MRGKLLSSTSILALSACLSLADRATFDQTKTQIAMPMDTPPTIDGVINTDEWQRAGGFAGNFWAVTPNANLTDGVQGGALGDNTGSLPTSASDLSFYIYAGYDSNNLYIAVHVTDDIIMTDDAAADSANGNTWMDDSVEVFIDGDNSNFATRDTTGTNPEVVGSGGQFVITANNAYRDAEAGSPGYGPDQAWYAKTALRSDNTGYDAEFRISLKTLGNPKPGDVIGFTLGVNDDDDGGGAERQLMWVGLPHTEATYGNLLLGRRSYDAPKTKAPTVDGVINAAEYAGAQEIKIDMYNGVYDLTSGDDTWEPTDHKFSAWVIHDADAIYVAVDATDDKIVTDSAEAGSDNGNTWLDDSVEIFFDADLDRNVGGPTASFEGQYVLTANGARRENEAANPTFGADADWFGATSTTSHGFQVEFKVKKSALLNPADGATLGFHICQNDDDGTGTDRKAQLGWCGRAHTEASYGVLKLAGAAVPTSVKVSSISVSGKNLVLAVQNSSCGSTLGVQKTATLKAAQWTDVTDASFGACQNGLSTVTFAAPPTSPEFYRIVIK